MSLIVPPYNFAQAIASGAAQKLFNPKTIIGGDSYAAQHTKDQGSNFVGTELDHQYISQGGVNWARMHSQGALPPFSIANNFGVGNTTSRDYVANQLPSIIAARPQISFWRGVTNDPKSGNFDGVAIPFSETQANVLTVIAAHALIGALLVMYTIPARGDATVQQRTQHNRINTFLRTLPKQYPNLILVDLAPYFVDHTSSTGDPLGGNSGSTTTLVDGTHESPTFAYLDGLLTWNALQPYLALRNPLETAGINNAYDASLNPTGNLLGSSAEMFGTGGGFNSDANTSGTVASNWLVRNFSNGIPVVASKGTRASPYLNGASWVTQRMILGISGSGMKQVFLQGPYIPLGAAGLSIGDVINAAALIKINVWTGLYGASLGLFEAGSGVTNQANSDMYPLNISGTYYPWPVGPTGFEMIQEVPPLTVSANVTSGVRLTLSLFVEGSTCAVDVEMAMPVMRKN